MNTNIQQKIIEDLSDIRSRSTSNGMINQKIKNNKGPVSACIRQGGFTPTPSLALLFSFLIMFLHNIKI